MPQRGVCVCVFLYLQASNSPVLQSTNVCLFVMSVVGSIYYQAIRRCGFYLFWALARDTQLRLLLHFVLAPPLLCAVSAKQNCHPYVRSASPPSFHATVTCLSTVTQYGMCVCAQYAARNSLSLSRYIYGISVEHQNNTGFFSGYALIVSNMMGVSWNGLIIVDDSCGGELVAIIVGCACEIGWWYGSYYTV